MDLIDSELARWNAWGPEEVARRLEGVDVVWYVAAGWALDLFQGGKTREHHDIEIGVPARHFPSIRDAFAEPEFEHVVVGEGRTWSLSEEALDAHHQTWVRERASGLWRLDVFREPWDGEDWICRRDERIRLPASQLVSYTADGIPYAQPEVVLLFKAKAARPKDESDFAAVLPLLDAERRRWLAGALELVHPRHRWLADLR